MLNVKLKFNEIKSAPGTEAGEEHSAKQRTAGMAESIHSREILTVSSASDIIFTRTIIHSA